MHPTTLCSRLARLISLGGGLVFATSGYAMGGMVAGGMAAASSGGSGGGLAIELWFVLMLALLGAAKWLDEKEATMVKQRVQRASGDLHRWRSGP